MKINTNEPAKKKRNLQNFSFQLLILLFIFGTTSARKIIIKSNVDRNSEFFKNKDFTFDQSKDDGKQPTQFKGDVMKSKTVVSENVQGKKNYKFA